MANYIALLRAVNVGGTGKLLMAKLQAICVDAGFTGVKTYIASGNVVFASPDSISPPRDCGCQQDCRQKDVCAFVVSSCDTTEVLESAEHALDGVSALIGCLS